MATPHSTPSRGTREALAQIRSHADLLASLPDPPEPFYARDLPDQYFGAIRTLCRVGVIEKCGWTPYEESSGTCREYRVEPWVTDHVQRIIATRDAICPCGHSGLKNCGDHFECQFAACDRAFTREELEVRD